MASLIPQKLSAEEFESLPWILACQKDSYEFTKKARVVKCYEIKIWKQLYSTSIEKREEEACNKKKKKKKKKSKTNEAEAAEPKYGILLNDTVFFPEGGGQPCDTGDIVITNTQEKINVVNCQRFGPGGKLVLHYTHQAIPENTEVALNINVQRRFDHMIHHSSQHLITAVALNTYNRRTLSWNLAPMDKSCYVELSGELRMEDDELQLIEKDVNSCIRNNLSMMPSFYTHEEYEANKNIRKAAKGLALGGSPTIRVVKIENLDENACCGTHVQYLKDLQAIKFVNTEKSKDGNTKVFYLTGERLLKRANILERNAKEITSLLTCGIDKHTESVANLLQSQKDTNRAMKQLLKNFAALSANVANHPEFNNETSNIIYQHLPSGNTDFMKSFIREVKTCQSNIDSIKHFEKLTIFVSVGNESSVGAFMIEGPEAVVSALGMELVTLWKAKGGGKKGRFQAKVPTNILNESIVLKGQEIAKTIVSTCNN